MIKISKSTLNTIGRIVLSLLAMLPIEQMITALLLSLEKKAKKTPSIWDDKAIEMAWILRDYIFQKTATGKRATLIKQIQDGNLAAEIED